ncbi:MAG: hypothetical protein M5R40_14640 [Anaerolineae bacterium]|nr:hypothetical protein [Anaerolineae bacterium]
MCEPDDDQPIARDAYEALAERYAALIDDKAHNAHYERPAMLALLPDVAGLARARRRLRAGRLHGVARGTRRGRAGARCQPEDGRARPAARRRGGGHPPGGPEQAA